MFDTFLLVLGQSQDFQFLVGLDLYHPNPYCLYLNKLFGGLLELKYCNAHRGFSSLRPNPCVYLIIFIFNDLQEKGRGERASWLF